MAKAAAKKTGASRNPKKSSARRSSGAGVPAWLWIFLGLAVAVFAAFLWYLHDLRSSAHKADKAASATALASPAASEVRAKTDTAPANSPADSRPRDNANAAQGEEPRFDFYTLLPNQEVLPTPHPKRQPAPTPAQRGWPLQAGAFKSEAEADKRRASILMLGLPVNVQKVTLASGAVWFRVVVGPFADQSASQQARQTLARNGVDSVSVKAH